MGTMRWAAMTLCVLIITQKTGRVHAFGAQKFRQVALPALCPEVFS